MSESNLHERAADARSNTAVLEAERGLFRIQAIRYEFDRTECPDSQNWVVVRVTWSGKLAQCFLEGPYLESYNFEAWGNKIVAFAESTDLKPDFLHLAATEPNIELRIARERRGLHVQIKLYGEPACVAEIFEANTPVSASALATFGRSLQQISVAFSSRTPAR